MVVNDLKHFENDFKSMLMMIQTMVLCIANDYEDADLKERAREIHQYLEGLEHLEQTKAEDILKQISNWREFHYQWYRYSQDEKEWEDATVEGEIVETLTMVLDILQGKQSHWLQQPKGPNGYQHRKYGDQQIQEN